MPNTVCLPAAAFLPLAQVPPHPVFAREEQGGSWLRSVRGFAVLLLLCLILYAPGLASIPPVDRVTGRDYSAGGSRVILTLYDLEPR